jgi:hypothetical protein
MFGMTSKYADVIDAIVQPLKIARRINSMATRL